MADYYAGKITFPEIALKVEDIKKVYDEYLEDLVETNIEVNEGVIELESDQARWGHFEDLEMALFQNGLPYDTETDSNYGDGAGIRVYRKEFGVEMYFDTSSYGGVPIVALDKIRELANDSVGLAAYLDKHFPKYQEISELVTEYTGGIKPHYIEEVGPGLKLLIRLDSSNVHYQMEHDGELGEVHVAKVVSIPKPTGTEWHTFFTKDGKQYWVHELTRVESE